MRCRGRVGLVNRDDIIGMLDCWVADVERSVIGKLIQTRSIVFISCIDIARKPTHKV